MKSSDAIRKNMQANKSEGTSIEIIFGRALWQKGIRYRKNVKDIFGKPDFSVKKYRLAIFVDGEFWHGKNWAAKKNEHRTNKEFWFNKIERNIKRDVEVNEFLIKNGWYVLRFWGNDVLKNTDKCVEDVLAVINKK